MALIWIGVAALVAALMLFLLKRGRVASVPSPRPMARRVEPAPVAVGEPPATVPVPLEHAAAPVVEVPVPALLAEFRLQRADDLPPERKQAYGTQFRDIPRPPRLLDHLLSPGFVNAASSAQLVDLIIGEPLIAGRVLTVTNSPIFGLETPVTSIGQAVTYLGLNKVKSLCLQYILIDSFKADSPERKKTLDLVWSSSALASELMQQLGQRLGFEDRGSLVSAVVLSFIGRLATTASMSRDDLLAVAAAHGLLERTIVEQQRLGLGATQIGRLLMREWGLPEQIVDDAGDIDAVMLKPSGAFDVERGSRLALCYLCARLGERIAEGGVRELSGFERSMESAPELFHARGYLAGPKLQRFMAALRSPEVAMGVQQTLEATRS